MTASKLIGKLKPVGNNSYVTIDDMFGNIDVTESTSETAMYSSL